jgi:hypothetical protein
VQPDQPAVSARTAHHFQGFAHFHLGPVADHNDATPQYQRHQPALDRDRPAGVTGERDGYHLQNLDHHDRG